MMFNELAWDKAHDKNINKIKQTALGRKMLSTLSRSKKLYTIKEPVISAGGLFSNNYSPKTNTIVLNSDATLYINTESGRLQVQADNILFHELGHAYLHEIGNSMYSDEMYVIKNFENIYGHYNRIDHGGGLFW